MAAESYRNLDTKISKLTAWKPSLSWIPEDPVPMLVQDMPVMQSASMGRPAEETVGSESSSAVQGPTTPLKVKKLASPKKNCFIIG
jgi:hypothetical protein